MLRHSLKILISAIILSLLTSALAQAIPPMTQNLEWKGRIVVEFADEPGAIQIDAKSGIAMTGWDDLDALARQFNVFKIEKLIPGSERPEDPSIRDISRYYILEFPVEVDLHEVASAYAANPGVITAEPYLIRTYSYVPNDTYFSSQWALDVTDAETAYDYTQGSASVIIGIVDSGTDTAHQDLRDNIWINPGEDLNGNGMVDPIEWNAIDDDQNGYADDFWGWNHYQNSNNVQDPPVGLGGGHGTHCAGDASAVTDNNLGIASLGYKAKVMTARAGDGYYIYTGMQGITYCVDNGAKVISLSWGGTGYSAAEQTIINNAWNQGVIIVAAAGNDGSQGPQYPAMYNNVVAVAATNQYDQVAGWSNFGTWIDVCAPGVNIFSTLPGSTYGPMSGTSMSTPITAGLCALVWAAKPTFTNAALLLQIATTCVDIYSLNPGYPAGTLGFGRIDAGAAVSTLFPNLEYTEMVFDDASGNGDGRPDPGETVDFLLTIENTSQTVPAQGVSILLECTDPDITILQDVNNLGDIGIGASVNNHSDPLSFSVDAGAQPHLVTFVLTLTETGTGLILVDEIEQMIGRPDVILVDDDGSANFEQWYEKDLDSLNVVYDLWHVNSLGEIPGSEIQIYPMVIWFTSNQDNPLSVGEQTVIENYLSNGGKLFLTGEDIDEQLGSTAFYTEVLHATSTGLTGSPQALGVEGDPISAGTTLFLAGAGGAGNSASPSTISPAGDAVLAYTYSGSGAGAGIHWLDANGMLVYFSFCFEAVSGISSTPRKVVLGNIMEWFGILGVAPSAKGDVLPESFSLNQNYPNPFNPGTEISFALPKQDHVKLTVFDLAGRAVTTLVNEELPGGYYNVTFTADHLASGVYLYRIETSDRSSVRKMILLK